MRGYRLVLVSALWTALTVPVLGLFVASVPALHARQRTPPPAVRVDLDRLGLPVPVYAGYWSVVLIAFAVLCFAVAGMIVWRRPREPMAWFTALFVIVLGAANAPSMEALVSQRPALTGAATAAFGLLLGCLIVLLFTFPDGRFVPRFAWLPAGVVIAVLLAVRGSVAGPIGEPSWRRWLWG